MGKGGARRAGWWRWWSGNEQVLCVAALLVLWSTMARWVSVSANGTRAAMVAAVFLPDGRCGGWKWKTGYDRFSARQAVIFICATNRQDELDPEFLRAGRIDRRLYIGLPNAEQRVQIFGVHSKGKQLAEDVDFEKLVYRTIGYSGADIRNLINEAGLMAVRKGHSMIIQQDIIDALDKELLEGMGMLLTEEEQRKCELSVSYEKRKMLAVHEAGHIVLAHLFPRFDWHAFSQLLPGGKETAISVFYPREDMVGRGYTTFGYMMMQMVVAHGGRCAEKLVFGDDITDGGKDDLEKITKIARELVISPRNARLGLAALTKRVGFVNLPESSDGEIKFKWDDPHVIPTNMTLEVSELFMQLRPSTTTPRIGSSHVGTPLPPKDGDTESPHLHAPPQPPRVMPTRHLTRRCRRPGNTECPRRADHFFLLYIEETEELAMKGLQDNRHILSAITAELLEKSRVTGLEVEERLKGLSPVMFEDFVQPFQINLDETEALFGTSETPTLH
ncbi:ATP-dependent zinc metalloprotease FTSH 12, chloroplastic [Dionaea muscipula]